MHTHCAFTVAGQSPVRTGFTDHSDILERVIYTFFPIIQEKNRIAGIFIPGTISPACRPEELVFPDRFPDPVYSRKKDLPRETLRIVFPESPDNHTGTDQYKSANLSLISLFFPEFYLLVRTSIPVWFISGKQIRVLEKNPILPEKALAFFAAFLPSGCKNPIYQPEGPLIPSVPHIASYQKKPHRAGKSGTVRRVIPKSE